MYGPRIFLICTCFRKYWLALQWLLVKVYHVWARNISHLYMFPKILVGITVTFSEGISCMGCTGSSTTNWRYNKLASNKVTTPKHCFSDRSGHDSFKGLALSYWSQPYIPRQSRSRTRWWNRKDLQKTRRRQVLAMRMMRKQGRHTFCPPLSIAKPSSTCPSFNPRIKPSRCQTNQKMGCSAHVWLLH